MPILKYRARTLSTLSALVPEITYVMCGARGETRNRLMRALPQMKFIGFEPDPKEHARLTARKKPGFTYFPVAVGGRDERATFYVTRNPACSSLLPPNGSFYRRFKDCASEVEVLKEVKMDVVSLDSFLPKAGIREIDFLDLDTQGSELEILQGAEGLVSKETVGVRCEVEFSHLYQNQPLFAEVDAYLRKLGFMLFDLSRCHYRRGNFPARALTRGQILWGNTLYLRDHAWFTGRAAKLPLFKLCLLAAHLQFHDYALEVLDCLLAGEAGELTPEEQTALSAARKQYLRDLGRNALWTNVLYGLGRVGLRLPIKALGLLTEQIGHRLSKDQAMMEYNWED